MFILWNKFRVQIRFLRETFWLWTIFLSQNLKSELLNIKKQKENVLKENFFTVKIYCKKKILNPRIVINLCL